MKTRIRKKVKNLNNNSIETTAALLIFIKNVEKGKVKTRLASTVGQEKALQIYTALLKHTRDVSLKLPVERLLFYSNFMECNDLWPNDHFQKFVQEGDGLGKRMQHAFKSCFKHFKKGIIIGSDCASLNPDIVQEAFNQLEHHSFVIGPAMDGGYYLLGMNAYEPSVFQDIEWSTASVFPSTLERIKALNKSYYLLPTLSDIDYEEDWKQYGWEI